MTTITYAGRSISLGQRKLRSPLNQCHDDLRVVINLHVPNINYLIEETVRKIMPGWNLSAVRKM